MGKEKRYTVTFKHSEVRELQLALMYHLDNVLIPLYEEKAKHWDNYPTQVIKKRIELLQRVLHELNNAAGVYKETE